MKETTTTNKSQQLQHQQVRKEQLLRRRCLGAGGKRGRAEQQRQTWLSVSPFIHQHLKRGTKQLGSVCWDCPFIPLSAEVYKNTKVTCVCFCKLQRGRVWPHDEGKSIFFYTLQRHILFSCCQWNKMSSLQDPWCWWWQKQTKKVRNKKKVVVPNAMMQMPLHHRHLVLVEVQVLGKADHRSNGQMETCRTKGQIFQKNGIGRMICWGHFFCFCFRERWLLEKN